MKTLPKLSRLMLGTVQFGLNYGIANKYGQPSQEMVRDIIACAYNGGVNCLDTAALYGESEEVIGKVLVDLGIRDMVIVTKIPSIASDLSCQKADEIIEESVVRSLKRLKLDVLPICIFHEESNFKYIESLCKMRSKGLVMHIGASTVTPEGAKDIVISGMCEAIQTPFNVLDGRFMRSEVISQAAMRDVSVFSRSVYLQGLILMNDDEIPQDLLEVTPVLKTLRTLAKEAGIGLKELAVRYVLSIDGISCVLVGVDTVNQMKENLCIAEKGPLDGEIMKSIANSVKCLPNRIVNPGEWKKRMADVQPVRSL